jgi:serine/threonine protein phosphatase 1
VTLAAALPLSRVAPASAGGAGAAQTASCEAQVFARFHRPRRIWAVAAIEGERARLGALHLRLAAKLDRGDRLIYLGGYLGRGADVAGTLDELVAFRRLFLARRYAFLGDVAHLRGGPEEMWQKLLQLQFAPNPREVLQWMLDHGMGPTLSAYGAEPRQGFAAAREGAMALTRWTASLRAALDARPGHRQLLTSLKRAALSDDGSLLFVHAGIDPGKPLERQGDVLWWGGCDILALDAPYGRFARVVRGHDPEHAGLRQASYAASLDGGSGFGGPLIAACFAPGGALLDRIEA